MVLKFFNEILQNERQQHMRTVSKSYLHVPCASRRYFASARGEYFVAVNIQKLNIVHFHFQNHFLWQLIMFLIRPAAIGLLLLTLWQVFILTLISSVFELIVIFTFSSHSGLVYYLRSKSKARIEMVKLLKEMLYIEAKDKEFLLANITRVTQNNG